MASPLALARCNGRPRNRLLARLSDEDFQHLRPLLKTVSLDPKQVLHKPVLLRVVNAAGLPRGGVTLESTWSSGTVLDNVKGETSVDGTVTLNLIPGRNYLTLRQRGCPKQEQRLDVRPGSGIDDFRLTLECR